MNKVIIIIIAVILLIQVVPIDRDNPQTMDGAEILVTPEVKRLLEKSCYDCHSNNTTWPWYSYVAPVSWLVANHVSDGRDELNFSEWNTYSEKRKNYKLKDIVEEIEEGEMPFPPYLLLHDESKLTSDQKDLLIVWAKSFNNISPDTVIVE